MKKTFNLSVLTVLLLVVTFLLGASLAYAQNSRLYLEPVDASAGSLVLDVVAENVTELYGAEFRLKFDPAVFSIQDFDLEKEGIQVEAGSFLPAEQGFIVVNQADEVEGIVTYALTLLNPAPPVNGTGSLARITFEVLQPEASATIEIENAKLVSFSLQTIPAELVSFDIGEGQPQTVPPQPDPNPPAEELSESDTPFPDQPQSEFPWWIIALGIILLGFLSLGVFAVVGGSNKPQPAAGANRQSPPNIRMSTSAPVANQAKSSDHLPGTRPSAFK